MHSLHYIATLVKRQPSRSTNVSAWSISGQIAPRVQLGHQHVNGMNTCLEPAAAFREKREAVFTER
jgi:hypothetical protein